MILACSSGLPRSMNACGTWSIDTKPVSRGARSTFSLGDRIERRTELERVVAEHELDVQLLADAEHRVDRVLLHAGADDEDPGVARRHPHRLLDHPRHADGLEDHERLVPVDPAPRGDRRLDRGIDDLVAAEMLGQRAARR